MAGLEGVYWDEEGQQYVPEEPRAYKVAYGDRVHYVNSINKLWFYRLVDSKLDQGWTKDQAYQFAMDELETRILMGEIVELATSVGFSKALSFASRVIPGIRSIKSQIPTFVEMGEGLGESGIFAEEERIRQAKAVTAAEKKALSYQKSQWEKLEKTKAKIVTKPKVVASIIEKYEKQHPSAVVVSEQIEPQVVPEVVPEIVVKKKQKKVKKIIPSGGISVSTSGKGYRRWRSAQRRKKRMALKAKRLIKAEAWYNP